MKHLSVIIPVYNVSRFLRKAVDSVLMQPEVDEIILIDDGSTDGSTRICDELQKSFPERIFFLTHPGRANLGAAITRNFGIENANGKYLAFLDADDHFLPNRFTNAMKLLDAKPDIDGIYEAIGTEHGDEEAKALHQRRMREVGEEMPLELTTMTKVVAPEVLFEALLIGHCGWFHFNGLTVRKSIFDKCGMLDPYMRYGQDTDVFLRMALHARLAPGCLDVPVAMRCVYSGNSTLSVFTNESRWRKNVHFNGYMWRKFFLLALSSDYGKAINRYLFFRYVENHSFSFARLPVGWHRKMVKALICLGLVLEHPKSLLKLF